MLKLVRLAIVGGGLGLVTAGCGVSTNEVRAEAGSSGSIKEGTKMPSGTGAINERFESLDAYLAYLRETQAPVDGPWYREVRPGVYVLQTAGNLKLDGGDPTERVYTREELERKFGFRN